MRHFEDDREKWEYLHAAPYADAQDPRVQSAAHALSRASRDRVAFVHLAFALARDGIRYQTDTARVGREDLGAPWDAYLRGVDDCDAKARLFCALCIARGIQARMVPRWERGVLTHVSAEVALSGQWYPVELTLARARLGDVAEQVPTEDDGKWLRP